MKLSTKKTDPRKIFNVQDSQYKQKLILTDTVPANSTRLGKVSISNLGHFLVEKITGTFETLYLSGTIQDDGICHLRGKLSDETTNRALFNDYIPFNLFVTPGRIKTVTSAAFLTDANPEALFWPDNFEYLFPDNGDISMDVKNDSNTPIKYNLCFHGWRFLRGKAYPV